MIKIHIDEDSLTLIVTGHAEYAPKGNDVVCAGVSTLVQTLGEYAACHGGKVIYRPGYARIDLLNGSRDVFSCIADGLKAIARQYDTWVCFT